MENKNLGILGLGNRSTLFYIDELNKRFNAVHRGYSTCPFILYNINFDRINPYLPNKFTNLEPVLSLYIKSIKKLGIKYLLIPNITLHETFDRINVDLDIAHPVQLTIDKLIESELKEVVVFGSLYTMQSKNLKDTFFKKEILLVEPKMEHRKFLDHFRKQIYYEQESNEDLEEYKRIMTLYSKDLPVVIACTELSIYTDHSNPKLFDMATIQIEKILSLFKNQTI